MTDEMALSILLSQMQRYATKITADHHALGVYMPDTSTAHLFRQMDALLSQVKRIVEDEAKSQTIELKHLVFPFEIKDISGTNEFTGIAAGYGNKDAFNEVIDKGAAGRKLAEDGGKVLLLADHNLGIESRIGIAYLTEKASGLDLRGVLNINDPDPTINRLARKALSDIRFYKEHGYQLGMSIGFHTLKDAFIQGVRHLVEVWVREASIVSMGANPKALVS